MIKTENITFKGREYIRTYSDAGRLVMRDGARYQEAIDPIEYASDRNYTEGDLIPDDVTDADYAQAGRILLGVTDNA